MKTKKTHPIIKYFSLHRSPLTLGAVIMLGGIFFSLSRQTPRINMAGGVKCSEYKGKESCQSNAGCYWNGEKSDGGTGCEQTTVPEAQGFSQLGFNTPTSKSKANGGLQSNQPIPNSVCDFALKISVDLCHRSCLRGKMQDGEVSYNPVFNSLRCPNMYEMVTTTCHDSYVSTTTKCF